MNHLVVFHEVSSTGAPILLYEHLHAIKEKNSDTNFDIIIIKGGDKLSDFEALGNCLKLFEFPEEEEQKKQIVNFLYRKTYSSSIFNTLESSHILSWIDSLDVSRNLGKIVFKVHELEGTIQRYGKARIGIINQLSDKIICVSNAVKNNLVDSNGFSDSKLEVIYGFPRKHSIAEATPPKPQFPNIKKIILGCGEITVGKGIDIFINTAKELKKIYDHNNSSYDFFFAWLGADNHKIKTYFEKEIEILDLKKIFSFFGPVSNIWPYFFHANFFYLASRQDSFPLVCLEACSVKLPIIYSKESGGTYELLGDKGGILVDYSNPGASADTIYNSLKGEYDLKAITDFASSRLRNLCDFNNNNNQFYKILTEN